MKGLLKNNVYAVLSNAKLFSAMMLVLGIFVVGIDHDAQIFIIGYMLRQACAGKACQSGVNTS